MANCRRHPAPSELLLTLRIGYFPEAPASICLIAWVADWIQAPRRESGGKFVDNGY